MQRANAYHMRKIQLQMPSLRVNWVHHEGTNLAFANAYHRRKIQLRLPRLRVNWVGWVEFGRVHHHHECLPTLNGAMRRVIFKDFQQSMPSAGIRLQGAEALDPRRFIGTEYKQIPVIDMRHCR